MAAKKPLFNRQMRRISELDANIQAGLAREEAERAKQAEAEIETVDYTPEQIAALDPALFEPAGFNEEDAERTGYSNYSYWASTFKNFWRNKVARVLIIALIAVLLFAFLHPIFPGPVSYTHLDVYKRQIVTRPAMEARRGEEKAVAKALANLGVPIVRTITGSATFEGAMCMWIDRKTVVLASGVRTNREGYEMMEYELRRMGVMEILHMQIPYGHAHIDGNLNFASHEVAAIHPAPVSYTHLA